MSEIKDGLTEEEFSELYWSLTDDEKLEISRKLFESAKENRDISGLTDEQIVEREAKLDQYAKVIEAKKRVHEMLHKAETAKQLVEDRINARYADMMETDPAHFPDEKKRKSN